MALEADYVATRLPVIAYEDVGVADLACLLWTKQAAATIPVQSEAERRRIATAIAGRLADCPKSRTACDIVCLTDCSPETRQYADELSRLGLTDWIDAATATTQPLIKRAVAWRFILGLAAGGRRPNIAVAGSRNAVLATAAEAMQLPLGLVAAIQAGTGTHNLHAALALAHELLHSTTKVATKRGNTSPLSGASCWRSNALRPRYVHTCGPDSVSARAVISAPPNGNAPPTCTAWRSSRMHRNVDVSP